MLGGIFKKLRHFDAYPKPLEDFRVKTVSGAIITLICTISIVILFIYEWKSYTTVDVDQELFVDLTRNQKLTINLNITFPFLPCELLSLDSMDVSGESHIEHKGLKKTSLDKKGRIVFKSYEEIKTTTEEKQTNIGKMAENTNSTNQNKCMSCYGAEASNFECCNTCDDVRLAYRQKNWHFSPVGVEQCKFELEEGGRSLQASDISKDVAQVEKLLNSGEGCQLAGHLVVNKVAGNFHIAPGISFQQNHMHFHDIKNIQINRFNTKHYFDVFSFGDEYPNMMNPLEKRTYKFENTDEINKNKEEKQEINVVDFGFFKLFQDSNDELQLKTDSISYSYFLKIVPTTYEYLDGKIVNNTYQYSVTKSIKAVTSNGMGSTLPGIFVNYELSPIMVKFIEKSKSFSHFLTGCCAIIGGLFTVAGMLDGFTYHYYKMFKKSNINKLT